ncbi:MAG: hypothetical protein GOU97_02370 [Nanoarchaeota archaeon]|nr:hypothetical protein [Nanoarchaeota archaeon]
MRSDNQSARIRNYAIAGFCIVLAVLAVTSFLKILSLGLEAPQINTRSECSNDSANVFIGANEDLKNVKCVALDKEFFDISEIVIGDLSKNDEDVCRFKLSKNTTEPLRFEVQYNGKVKREVCEWQHYPRYAD